MISRGGGGLLVGYNVSTASDRDPAADAEWAESVGFDFVSLSDHLHGTHPTNETWTQLTWMAAATQRVGLVTNVLGLPYRPVAVLAKMAETLQRLSGDRLVLGLGAGGNPAEFAAFGLALAEKGADKLTDLADAIEAMRLLWTSPNVDVDARAFRLAGATVTPRPRSPLPIWIGGYGPRMLDLIGRTADGWLPSMPFAPPEQIPAMRTRVRRASGAAGRNPDAVVAAYNVGVFVGRSMPDRPVVSGGSVDEVAERLIRLVDDLELDAVNLWPVGAEPEQRPFLVEVASRLGSYR